MQELQLNANQADLDFRSDIADKEDLISKLNTELRAMEDRLGQQEGVVSAAASFTMQTIEIV